MATVQVASGGRASFPIAPDRTVFLYIVHGDLSIAGRSAQSFHLVEFNNDGDHFEMEAITDSVLLLGHALPLREPIVAHGPFVMNTREEIMQAIRDYQAGALG
jgi:hypothetical protein